MEIIIPVVHPAFFLPVMSDMSLFEPNCPLFPFFCMPNAFLRKWVNSGRKLNQEINGGGGTSMVVA